jgi:hypothetical protein
MLKLLGIVGFIYLVFLLLIALNQRKLTYFPTRRPEAFLVEMAGQHGLVAWTNAAGQLMGWRSPASKALRRIVIFHGNGGMALDRVDMVRSLRNLSAGGEWDVYLFEYPGMDRARARPRRGGSFRTRCRRSMT